MDTSADVCSPSSRPCAGDARWARGWGLWWARRLQRLGGLGGRRSWTRGRRRARTNWPPVPPVYLSPRVTVPGVSARGLQLCPVPYVCPELGKRIGARRTHSRWIGDASRPREEEKGQHPGAGASGRGEEAPRPSSEHGRRPGHRHCPARRLDPGEAGSVRLTALSQEAPLPGRRALGRGRRSEQTPPGICVQCDRARGARVCRPPEAHGASRPLATGV